MRSCADAAPRRALRRLRSGGRAAAIGAAVLACGVASPATEVKEALARLAPAELDAGGARVALTRVSFSDVAVSMDGPSALVVAMLQADGWVRLAGAEPSLAYVGREAFRMERCAGKRWCLAADALAGLRGVVATLAADPTAGPPVAWQVRVDRDVAEAGVDYEATQPDGPRRLRVRYTLARDGASWRILRRP